jgi:hypothetical protein
LTSAELLKRDAIAGGSDYFQRRRCGLMILEQLDKVSP